MTPRLPTALRVRNANDIAVGGMLIAIALLALFLARNLAGAGELGLGPGSVPRLLCGIQIALGLVLIATGLMRSGLPLEPWVARPLVWIPVSVIFFAVTIERLGLVVAVSGLVMLACLANRHTRLSEGVGLAAVMTVFSVVVFVSFLGQTMAVWPPILTD